MCELSGPICENLNMVFEGVTHHNVERKAFREKQRKQLLSLKKVLGHPVSDFSCVKYAFKGPTSRSWISKSLA